MKKIFLILVMFTMSHNAYAVVCSGSTSCTSTSKWLNALGTDGISVCLAAGEPDCYYINHESVRVANCDNCGERELINVTVTTSEGCTVTYRDCGLSYTPMTCPDECPNSDWTPSGTGYEVRCALRSCQYRCAAGYYGSPTSATSGCTSCASATSKSNATSIAGENSEITGCYVPSGSDFSDTAGSGTYSSDCYWSE